jgi:hypothetical protein
MLIALLTLEARFPGEETGLAGRGSTWPEAQDRHSYVGPERRGPQVLSDVEPVRLTRKYAEAIDGVDLSGRDIGDRLPLPRREARMLLAEGWAQPASSEDRRGSSKDGQDYVRREAESEPVDDERAR